jgi:hypothetical protein
VLLQQQPQQQLLQPQLQLHHQIGPSPLELTLLTMMLTMTSMMMTKKQEERGWKQLWV